MKVEFYPIETDRNAQLKYVIIVSHISKDQWIFVRHKERETWELPAGHIEVGEHPDQAAKRELFEETGATIYSISILMDYSVKQNGIKTFGRVYFAEVEKLGDLPESEIAEIIIQQTLPSELTYPEIQRIIFQMAQKKSETQH